MGFTKSHRTASLRILQEINKAKDEHGNDRAAVFHELPPRAELPDYYQVIQKPMALDMVRDKRSKYQSWQDFKQDVFQIFHNAKTYNRRDSPIYIDAEALEDVVEEEMKKLVAEQTLTSEEAERPDLGPLPGGSQGSDDDAEMEEASGSPSSAKRRKGRPAYTETPEETIMSNIIKRIRKVCRGAGKPLAPPFERLPDKAEYPDYYQTVKNPMCLTQAKANIKKKVYSTVDAFVADLELIFRNAQLYNEDGSAIYQAASTLLIALKEITAAETKQPEPPKPPKPEPPIIETPAVVQEEPVKPAPVKNGRRMLESVQSNGHTYALGDWILVTNPNDKDVPCVAQVHQCFQVEADQSFGLHVCWFFRPEQTIHRSDRLFYDNEVFKTNHYRDQALNDVVGPCLVRYYTKYVRSRAKFPPGRELQVFVCESRYNVEEKKFTKIKSWKSCLPEGVRDEEVKEEAEPYPAPITLPRKPSSLLYLLPNDQNQHVYDPMVPLPEAFDQQNRSAPPKIGNVYIGPPIEEQGPMMVPYTQASPERGSAQQTLGRPTAPLRQSSKTSGTPARGSPMPGSAQPPLTYASPYVQAQPTSQLGSYTSPYASAGTSSATPSTQQTQQPVVQSTTRIVSVGNRVHPTALTLTSPQGPQLTLEEHVKRRFLRDADGEIVWFTVPPVDPVAKALPEEGVLGHSLAYELWRLKQQAQQ
ncbi:Bromodomain-containing protein [Protomyces lactucae-debilis]|uniref:Bromodomain-containing protein n=1 Tax=Protomyces lactucae-debilis TaxID=2754530 RepID=A0A1Y2FK84_PROLT|nr:Bromodomain-containing protein [Protomyces lactucae-debilis]ORY84391.1 Bromodomain-containing protein [Protomyces lactucae-debilis]